MDPSRLSSNYRLCLRKGALGLVAMKNLLEVGFNVVGFDKHPYVGGLWNYNEQKDAISVLRSKPFTENSC